MAVSMAQRKRLRPKRRKTLAAVALAAVVVLAGLASDAAVEAAATFGTGASWSLLAWGWSNGGEDVSTGRQVVFLDPDVPSQAALMPSFKAEGKTIICYISVGTAEPFRADVLANESAWSEVALNHMDTWDEEWVDISKLSQLQALMGPRFERAALAGCDGIEPDNSDCYANPTCYRNITAAGGSAYQALLLQLEYNTWQVTKAHEYGLLIGLKNSLALVPYMSTLYDFAVNEECFLNEECGLLRPFVNQGKAVFNVEYSIGANTCQEAAAYQLSSKMCAGADGMCVTGTWTTCEGATPSPTAAIPSPPSADTNAPTPYPTTPPPTTKSPTTMSPTTPPPTTMAPTTPPPTTASPTTPSPTTPSAMTPSPTPPSPTTPSPTTTFPPTAAQTAGLSVGPLGTMPPNTTFANLAWGWSQGGQDSSRDMDAVMVDLDTMDADKIQSWRANGKKVVCYFSAGSRELHRADVDADPAAWQAAVLGATADTVNAWLDIGDLAKLQALMTPRLDRAVTRGCTAIEPDFLDCALQSSCVDLLADPANARADQLVYNRWLASAAHDRGLLVALKNALGLVDDLVDDFDWAINEQCLYYDECGLYAPFHAQNKSIWVHHYSVENRTALCEDAHELSIQLKYCDGGNHSVNDMCESGRWANCFNSNRATLSVDPPAGFVAQNPVPWADLTVSYTSSTSSTTTSNGTSAKDLGLHVRGGSRGSALLATAMEERVDNVTGVKIVLVDLHEVETGELNEKLVRSLADPERRVVCAFSAGLREAWRADDLASPDSWAALTSTQKGRDWLDIRTTALRSLMSARIDAAAEIGCDGVLPLHVYCHLFSSCRRGFSLTREEADAAQYVYNDWLATRAASHGLIIGLHADYKLSDALASKFDFALAEGCISRGTCGHFMVFLESGMPVFNREYEVQDALCAASDRWGVATKMCPGDARTQQCDADVSMTNCFQISSVSGSAEAAAESQAAQALELTPVVGAMLGAAIACVGILVFRRHRRAAAAKAAEARKLKLELANVNERPDNLDEVAAELKPVAVPSRERARASAAV